MDGQCEVWIPPYRPCHAAAMLFRHMSAGKEAVSESRAADQGRCLSLAAKHQGAAYPARSWAEMLRLSQLWHEFAHPQTMDPKQFHPTVQMLIC
eukprot:518926-Pelagomonas_calceolata.AAC.1